MIATIANIFGWIIRLIYGLVNNNYFLSIIIFTILTKLILFPLTYIQLKSMEKMNRIGPKDKAIREKYKNDKQKQSEELMKLYQENKINPMGGCLPLLIQIPIILGMFAIVRQPLTYITQTTKEEITTYAKEVLQKEDVSDREASQNELLIAKEKNLIDMNVINGINMGEIPSNSFSKDESKKANPISLSIPILIVILSIVQIKISQNAESMSEEQKEMSKTTNLMMPLLSGFIAYTQPLALGIYWLFGNILQIKQQFIINKIVNKDKEKLALDKGGN